MKSSVLGEYPFFSFMTCYGRAGQHSHQVARISPWIIPFISLHTSLGRGLATLVFRRLFKGQSRSHHHVGKSVFFKHSTESKSSDKDFRRWYFGDNQSLIWKQLAVRLWQWVKEYPLDAMSIIKFPIHGYELTPHEAILFGLVRSISFLGMVVPASFFQEGSFDRARLIWGPWHARRTDT